MYSKDNLRLKVSMTKLYIKTKTEALVEVIENYKSQRTQREGNLIQVLIINYKEKSIK